MERIVIIGCCGAGKSTLARTLGDRLGLPVIHLDKLYWKPGWVESSREEFDARLDGSLSRKTWIIDGNYGRTLSKRIALADCVVFMNFPTLICLRGILWRRIRHGRSVRADMAEGCPERFNFEFFRYVATFRRKALPGVLKAIDEYAKAKKVVELRSHRQTQAWLDSLPPAKQKQT